MRGRWHATYTAWTCHSQLATAESLTATQRPKRALRRPYSSTPLFVAGPPCPPRAGPAGDPHRGPRPSACGGVRGVICPPPPPGLVGGGGSRAPPPTRRVALQP